MRKLLFILFFTTCFAGHSQVWKPAVWSTPVAADALEILFDDIANADALIGGGADTVGYWNTFFGFDGDPSLYTSIFSSVTVDGDTVKLYGGSGITIKESLFDGASISSIWDKAGSIIYLDDDCFDNCTILTYANFPSVISNGITDYGAFYYCDILTTIILPSCTQILDYGISSCPLLETLYIPLCTDLGKTTGDDGVFDGNTGLTLTLTVHASLLTCNGGAPDGDLCTLNANNTLTINGGSLSGCP